MKTLMMTTAAATLIAGAAFAEGNAADGEAAFKQCQSCHVVVDDEGNTLAGRKAKTGPNLFGVPGVSPARSKASAMARISSKRARKGLSGTKKTSPPM